MELTPGDVVTLKSGGHPSGRGSERGIESQTVDVWRRASFPETRFPGRAGTRETEDFGMTTGGEKKTDEDEEDEAEDDEDADGETSKRSGLRLCGGDACQFARSILARCSGQA